MSVPRRNTHPYNTRQNPTTNLAEDTPSYYTPYRIQELRYPEEDDMSSHQEEVPRPLATSPQLSTPRHGIPGGELEDLEATTRQARRSVSVSEYGVAEASSLVRPASSQLDTPVNPEPQSLSRHGGTLSNFGQADDYSAPLYREGSSSDPLHFLTRQPKSIRLLLQRSLQIHYPGDQPVQETSRLAFEQLPDSQVQPVVAIDDSPSTQDSLNSNATAIQPLKSTSEKTPTLIEQEQDEPLYYGCPRAEQLDGMSTPAQPRRLDVLYPDPRNPPTLRPVGPRFKFPTTPNLEPSAFVAAQREQENAVRNEEHHSLPRSAAASDRQPSSAGARPPSGPLSSTAYSSREGARSELLTPSGSILKLTGFTPESSPIKREPFVIRTDTQFLTNPTENFQTGNHPSVPAYRPDGSSACVQGIVAEESEVELGHGNIETGASRPVYRPGTPVLPRYRNLAPFPRRQRDTRDAPRLGSVRSDTRYPATQTAARAHNPTPPPAAEVPSEQCAEVNVNLQLAQAVALLADKIQTLRGAPPAFTRKYAGLVHEHPVIFIEELNQHFADHGIVGDAERMRVVALSLNGAAKEWFEPMRIYHETYRGFVHRFIENYNSREFLNSVRVELYATRQGPKEPVDSFIRRKVALYSRIALDGTQPELIELIMPLLRPNLRAHLRYHTYYSWDEFVARAIELERDVLEGMEQELQTSRARPYQAPARRDVSPQRQNAYSRPYAPYRPQRYPEPRETPRPAQHERAPVPERRVNPPRNSPPVQQPQNRPTGPDRRWSPRQGNQPGENRRIANVSRTARLANSPTERPTQEVAPPARAIAAEQFPAADRTDLNNTNPRRKRQAPGNANRAVQH
nr:MAG: hypothetical protein [Ips erranti-like virus 1]